MGAILLGSANGTPPSPGSSPSVELPNEVPVDPVVLQDTITLGGIFNVGGGTIDPEVLENYYTKAEIDTILADYVTFDDLVGLEGTPMYVHLTGTLTDSVDTHLSNVTDWNVDKAVIKMIRIETSSTNWDLYLLQNDNGYAADDAGIPRKRIMLSGNGDEDVNLDHAYEDEDATQEVHLYFVDNSGSASATVYIAGFKLQ
jgi:hypothetical protein